MDCIYVCLQIWSTGCCQIQISEIGASFGKSQLLNGANFGNSKQKMRLF